MKKLLPEERAQLVQDIVQRNAAGLDPIGASIRRLRLEVTGLDQETFAAMCRMSTKSLYELESGKSNPKLSTLEAVLRLFGVRMGMVMTAKDTPFAAVIGTPLAGSNVVAGPKRGKSPAAAKVKRAASKPASPRARKRSEER
ncbi:helix-turn-helix domain-containing protein [Pseudomonas plecoglossicida]|uniref:helix-turn-helix domain-containing protein n=1 Tax=Pseudomonas plecoglossicida TaxID=70775 RepID=UPI0015E41B0D|nr:helix-turn-helix transcriptional regulator [Pseudomonas plecoglossicida]MBA1323408.1 helix-turn-helix transcriptional regulator [Pseudomonas plecoglossicida]